jgi:hypothetical protein
MGESVHGDGCGQVGCCWRKKRRKQRTLRSSTWARLSALYGVKFGQTMVDRLHRLERPPHAGAPTDAQGAKALHPVSLQLDSYITIAGLRAYPQIMFTSVGTFRKVMMAAARWLSATKLRSSFS